VSWAIWVTGLPGSGKSALARAAAEALRATGVPVTVLELDRIRRVLTPRPTYGEEERELVYRALACMAQVLTEAGRPVIVDATAHRRAWRDLARQLIPRFAEVQLICPVEVARAREEHRLPGAAPPGVYARSAQAGATVPGVNVDYEPSAAPEVVIDTTREEVPSAAARIAALARQLEKASGPARPESGSISAREGG